MIHTPLLPVSGVLWISWGCSHIYIGPFCYDGLPCWIILNERLWKWGWCTAEYGCSLLLCLIKWLPFPFIGFRQARRSVPPLCFIHSPLRSVVACRLGYLLPSTMLVVFLCSIVSKNFLTVPHCIPWLWMIYPWCVGEPEDLIRPPYVWWIRLGCPFSSKIMKGIPRSPW